MILDSCDVDGNVQNQVERTLEFIKRNIRRSIVVTGKAEHDRVWEYPIEALRETITNAICHRDYTSQHDIQIKIMEDRLVIISPGLLPFDMDIATLENPEHGSRPRNKLIAQVFYDLHLIEHYGSGIRRIKNECVKNGNRAPEWSQQYGSFITVYESRLGRDTINEGINNGREGIKEGINEGIKIVLDLVRVRPGINAPEIASLMSKGLSTVERIISEGIKRGEIEHRGSKKTGGYYAVK